MEKSIYQIKLENENSRDQQYFRCTECSETFQRPLLATFSSMGYVQKYTACPRCLSKVTIAKQHESSEKREANVSLEKVKKVAVEKSKEDNAKCKHFLGYLKSRPKDMSFPEECLTCDRMIECMLH